MNLDVCDALYYFESQDDKIHFGKGIDMEGFEVTNLLEGSKDTDAITYKQSNNSNTTF